MNVEALPLAARLKLTAIRQDAEDAIALNAAGAKTVARQRARETHLRSTLARLESGGDQNLAAIAATEDELAGVVAEIERITALIGRRQRRVQNDNDLARSIEQWLSRQRDGSFGPAAVTASPLKGESLEAAIERVRSGLVDLEAERKRVAGAPRAAAEVKAVVRQRIDAQAEKGRARVYGLTGGEIRIDLLPSTLPRDDLGQMFNRDVVENMMCWLHRDAIVARLEAEIDAAMGGEPGMTAAEKAKREAEFPGRILALEREEEALIEQAIAAGIDVVRRPRASPMAVLGIAPAPAASVAQAA